MHAIIGRRAVACGVVDVELRGHVQILAADEGRPQTARAGQREREEISRRSGAAEPRRPDSPAVRSKARLSAVRIPASRADRSS
jgi:hypothetical protein